MNRAQQLTWIAHLSDILRSERGLPDGYTIRATEEADKAALAALYFATYPREIVADPAAALEEIERAFLGDYGDLDFAASPVAFYSNAMTASVTTVVKAPWEDTPPGPFIIEVMVHPEHRRRGLAECLISHAARELTRQGKRIVALRVMSNNTGALRLYRKLGFVPWSPDEEGHGSSEKPV
jgi:ribosomal protein S18 acetylase RimI-like enzyme